MDSKWRLRPIEDPPTVGELLAATRGVMLNSPLGRSSRCAFRDHLELLCYYAVERLYEAASDCAQLAATRNPNSFREARNRCEKERQTITAIRVQLESHRSLHRC